METQDVVRVNLGFIFGLVLFLAESYKLLLLIVKKFSTNYNKLF